MATKLSLNDVKKRIITVTVESLGNTVLEVDIQLPSVADWNNALLEVEFPIAEPKRKMVNGALQDVTDYNDPEYLRLRNAALEKLAMIRVTQALLGAGNFEELADMSLSDAAEKLEHEADKTLINSVNRALVDIMGDTKGGVKAKLAAFPDSTVSEGHNDNLSEKELVK